MKKQIFLTAIAVALLACNNAETKTEATDPNGIVWAEKIISQSYVSTPDGWAEDDWKAETNYDKEKICNTMLNGVKDGSVKAYNWLTDSLLSAEEVKAIFEYNETVIIPDSLNPMEVKQEIVAKKIEMKDIARIDAKEKWIFNEEKFHLEKQVESLIFYKNHFDSEGSVNGVVALFKVKLN